MAVWTTKYINDLPDSAFLYVEPGGKKDSEGKTEPRSKRHFPVKDANGNLDATHVRNALSRIPQANVPAPVKAAAKKQAEKYLASAKKMSEPASVLIPIKAFAEGLATNTGDESVWIHYAPLGSWSHPQFGRTTITTEKATKLVDSFHKKVRGQDILTDYDHGLDANKGGKASGEIVDMEVRNDGVWSAIKFTETAKDEIAKGEWKYFSPEFYEEWVNPMTDTVHEMVPSGGGLTNKPWIKGMVPINFSEVVVEENFVKFRKEKDATGDAEHYIIIDGDEERIATVDEVAEWEHSEPGTGSPPVPDLESEPDPGGDNNGSGSRRDSPPPQPGNHKKEGSVVKLSKEAAEALGITLGDEGEIDEQEVDKRVLVMFSELKPLREAELTRNRERAFSEQFPVEHAELMAQRNGRLESEAKKFSEQYERLTIGEGDEATKSTRGLSALALDKVQETHKLFAEGKTSEGMKAFSEMMSTITSDKGIVDYGEKGSGREGENNDDTVPTDKLEAARKFSELAIKSQKDAKAAGEPLSWGDAVSKTANEHPELWAAYNGSPTPVEE
jgi:hypothetical protein